MSLQEIRNQLLVWKVNPKPEQNAYIDMLISIIDHIIKIENTLNSEV